MPTRSPAHLLLGSVLFLWNIGTSGHAALADNGIADPKAWCATLTRTLSEGDATAVAKLLEKGSAGKVDPVEAELGLKMILNQMKQAGKADATVFLAEKDLQGAFRTEWFMIVIAKAPYFVRCDLINYAGDWQFANFDLKAKSTDVGL
jgi:hypothetical protein